MLEAMKMEHLVVADAPGRVRACARCPATTWAKAIPLVLLEPARRRRRRGADGARRPATDAIRPDLQRVLDRHAHTLDAARPEAIAKRHALGLRTARENIADLCDAGQLRRIRRARRRRAAQPPQRSTT